MSAASAKKAWAIMASKTCPEPAETVIAMAELGARVARRKVELGLVDPGGPELAPGRNPGTTRTPLQARLSQRDRGCWREVEWGQRI